jgi:Spy/CpxP family protein refolding chaperone
MTEAGRVRKTPGGPLLALMVVVIAVLAGAVAGIAVDRLILLPHSHREAWHGGAGLHGGPGRPPRDREFRNRFARELGLSSQQRISIDSIMDRQGRELRGVRREVQPRLDSIVSRTRAALDSVLTPEQRKKAEAIRRRHPRPPGPPPPPR